MGGLTEVYNLPKVTAVISDSRGTQEKGAFFSSSNSSLGLMSKPHFPKTTRPQAGVGYIRGLSVLLVCSWKHTHSKLVF